MLQLPLPTGMPESVASYCASTLPWAEAVCGMAVSANPRANRLPIARSAIWANRGEIVLCVVT